MSEVNIDKEFVHQLLTTIDGLLAATALLNQEVKQLQYRIYRCERGTPMHPKKPEQTDE